jgi:RNase_H superfamily
MMKNAVGKKKTMARRYLAFDIETAKDVPGDDFNWRPHRPLGISCAATLASDANQPVLWHGKTPDGKHAAKMSPRETLDLVEHLSKMAADGYTILTWNGLGFDFDILAEESAAAAVCKNCALNHVDMMFHVVCSLGYPVALDNAARGMGLAGKPRGMTGDKAPALWAAGHFKKVLDYVAEDVRMAVQIAQKCDQRHTFEWITQKGAKRSLALPKGWLTVREAMKLPVPDTSWMTKPLSRKDFAGWLL